MLFGSTLCHIMEQIRLEMGNPLVFFIVIYVPNATKYIYINTESFQVYYSQEKGVVSVSGNKVVSSQREAIA